MSSGSTWSEDAGRVRGVYRRALTTIAGVLSCTLAVTSCRAGSANAANAANVANAAQGTHAAAIDVTDDGGAAVDLDAPARRIISLIPSATETLIALAATDRIVGRTRYDVAPEVAAVPLVGGTTDPSIEAIVGLHPDLVVTWDADKRATTRTKLLALGLRSCFASPSVSAALWTRECCCSPASW